MANAVAEVTTEEGTLLVDLGGMGNREQPVFEAPPSTIQDEDKLKEERTQLLSEYKETDEFGKSDSLLANIARAITFFVYTVSLSLLAYYQATNTTNQDIVFTVVLISSFCLFFGMMTPESQRKSFHRFIYKKALTRQKLLWAEKLRNVLYTENKQRTGHLFNDKYVSKYFEPFTLALTSDGAKEEHRAIYESMKVQVGRYKQRMKENEYQEEIIETAITLEGLLAGLERSRSSQVFMRHSAQEKQVLRSQIVTVRNLLQELESKENSSRVAMKK